MGHGTPDWGQTSGAQTVYQLTDLAELAVRLGSIVSFDRRGDVIWLDDFEEGIIKWATEVSGAAGAVTADTSRARNGAVSVKVVAGLTEGQESGIQKSLPFVALSPFGFEVSASLPSADFYLRLRLVVYTGTAWYEAAIRYWSPTTTFQYLDSSGVWQNLAPVYGVGAGAAMWNSFKLVADFTTFKYVRFIANGRTYLLTGLALQTGASSTTPSIFVAAKLSAANAVAVSAYLDDVIITQNEPV